MSITLEMPRGRRTATRLLLTAATSALALAAPAAAQTAPAPLTPDQEAVADIIVTGIRGSLQRAAEVKRDAPLPVG